MRAAAGFTLIELLVAMAVLALGLVFAVPMLSDPSPGTKVRAAASEIASALKEARSEAIYRNVEVVMLLDVDRHAYSVIPGTRRGALPRDVDLALLAADVERIGQRTANIRFFPDGSSTGGKITLSKGATSYAVTVPWLTGRAKIDAPPVAR